MTVTEPSRLDAVEILAPGHLLLVWDDGHESLYSAAALRKACVCAACVDEWSHEAILDPASVASGLEVIDWQLTGRYGLQLSFSDGHSSGIYTLRRLRELCACSECR